MVVGALIACRVPHRNAVNSRDFGVTGRKVPRSVKGGFTMSA
jgi:hypothetical protein